MIKVLGAPGSKRWIGDTAGLVKLQTMGMVLRYEVATRHPEYAVRYQPRTQRDPMPWVQVGGLESRLRSTEIVAIEADAFAAWEAAQAPAPEAPAAPRYTVTAYGRNTRHFAVYDTVTELDVANGFTSRYAATDKARRLNEAVDKVTEILTEPTGLRKCIHGRHQYKTLRAASIPVCAEGERYGVWDDNDAGFLHIVDCAQDAVTWAAEQMDDEPDYELEVKAVCPDHEDQPGYNCESCNAEGCGAVDPEDLDACGKCRDCNPAQYD